MAWIKRIGFTLLLLFLCGALASYFYLKSIGILATPVYEIDPPAIPDFSRPAVLVLNRTNGYIHKEALPAADAMLQELAETNGWDIFITDNAASHNVVDLQRFALVVWNNTSGDILTESQRTDLKQWLEQGGGWLGIHAAGGDPWYDWGWYVDTLLGAQFTGHTQNPHLQAADLLVTNPALVVTSHLPERWRFPKEEWYAFDRNPRDNGYEIVLAIDEASYNTHGKSFKGNDRMEGEHPLSWRHNLGQGRVFYSAIGHRAETYDIPEYRELLSRAMRWAMGETAPTAADKSGIETTDAEQP